MTDADRTDSRDRDKLVTDDPAVVADRLAAGGVAAIPTETVYGLAADITHDAAIRRVFEIKGRPEWHPLIVHFGLSQPERWAAEGWIGSGAATEPLTELAATFWPGPLTLIVDAGPRISPLVTGGRDTVGIRVPSQQATETMLQLLGHPVAAPSANRFGRVSPTDVAHVLSDIGALLTPGTDVVLDGGATICGVESTIVDLTVQPAQLLRHGAIDVETLSAILGQLQLPGGAARASGMLNAHYAPAGFVLVADDAKQAAEIAGEYTDAGFAVEIIDRSQDPVAAARNLYRDLRRADAAGVDGVVVVAPAAVGIGVAVRDRLQRAASGSAPPSRGRSIRR